MIARLNMGGPALHVSYLAGGLEARGYRTTLVSGSLSRGEGSMSYVAEERGVKVVSVPELARELSPPNDVVAVRRLVELIRRERPHILHTHTAKAGAIGRLAARLSGRARPPIVVHTFHGHVLRGYFGPLPSEAYRRMGRLELNLRKAFILGQVRLFLMAFPTVSRPRCDYVRPYLRGLVDIGAALLWICSRGPTAIAP